MEDLPESPTSLFYTWLDTAIERGVPEPHATTLATVDSDGMPDARTLLVKDIDDRGWGSPALRPAERPPRCCLIRLRP